MGAYTIWKWYKPPFMVYVSPPSSGFQVGLIRNVICYHQSFVGQDYMAWAQMALFIIYLYLGGGDKVSFRASFHCS